MVLPKATLGIATKGTDEVWLPYPKLTFGFSPNNFDYFRIFIGLLAYETIFEGHNG